ncbi:unnamed protein product, partial [Owenia fusiformis]
VIYSTCYIQEKLIYLPQLCCTSFTFKINFKMWQKVTPLTLVIILLLFYILCDEGFAKKSKNKNKGKKKPQEDIKGIKQEFSTKFQNLNKQLLKFEKEVNKELSLMKEERTLLENQNKQLEEDVTNIQIQYGKLMIENKRFTEELLELGEENENRKNEIDELKKQVVYMTNELIYQKEDYQTFLTDFETFKENTTTYLVDEIRLMDYLITCTCGDEPMTLIYPISTTTEASQSNP